MGALPANRRFGRLRDPLGGRLKQSEQYCRTAEACVLCFLDETPAIERLPVRKDRKKHIHQPFCYQRPGRQAGFQGKYFVCTMVTNAMAQVVVVELDGFSHKQLAATAPSKQDYLRR